jgi:exodeoxyribonuclease V alpha subunit
METLIAQIEHIAYRKEDSFWTIALTDKGTIKGVISFDVKEGDWVKLEGKWQHSEFNGKDEFDFRGAMLHLPDDPRVLLTYAVSLTKGLGAAKEVAIWEKYGADWQQQETLDLSGVGESTQFHWADTLRRLKEQAEQTQAIAFLLAHGCTLNLATLAWETWKHDTLGMVNADPYKLCDLPRYGFKWIDENVRPKFGIAANDSRRIDAAILYMLNQLAEKYGTCIAQSFVSAETRTLVPHDGKFNDRIEVLIRAEKIMRVGSAEGLALAQDYVNEDAIWERWGNDKP